MAMPRNLGKWLPAAAVGAAAVTLTPTTAVGFFPPLPVTPDVVTVSPTPPVFVPPTIPVPPPIIPPAPPPPFTPPSPPPPVVVPQDGCTCPTKPQIVPEPASAVSATVGLTLLGAAAWKRRKKLYRQCEAVTDRDAPETGNLGRRAN